MTAPSVDTRIQPADTAEFLGLLEVTANLRAVNWKLDGKYKTSPVVDANLVGKKRVVFTCKGDATSRRARVIMLVETSAPTLLLVAQKSGGGKVIYKAHSSGKSVPVVKNGPQNVGLIL